MKYRKRFQPLSGAVKERNLVAFDCEGIGGTDGFLCGSVVSVLETVFFTSRRDMLEYLCDRQFAGSLIAAHNLDYDLALLTGGDFRIWDMLFADGRLLSAVLRDQQKKKWTFVDSSNLFTSFTVRDLGLVLGSPKLDLSQTLTEKITAGLGWLDFDLWEQNQIRDYNIRDSEIVWQALTWLQDELLTSGGQLQGTIAGCTMDLFRRAYLDTAWDTPDLAVNEWFRRGYYGARTEPLKLGKVPDLNGYDFTSLYPSIQATTSFPHPNYLALDDRPRRLSDFDKKQGIAHATVNIPDCHIPPLPVRRHYRLFFPTGKVTGTWPLSELRYALHCGCDLVSLDWVFWGRVSFNPFADFLNDLFSRRTAYKRDQDTRERLFKLLLNSAYGRFGVRCDGSLQRLIPLPPDPDWHNLAGGQFVTYQGWPYVLYPVAEFDQPHYTCVPFAAQIAAGSRVRLHSAMIAAGQSTAYVDTDSIFTSKELTTGEGLGELRQDFAGCSVEIAAAKEYRVTHPDHRQLTHVKGVPDALQDDYLLRGRVTFDSPVTIREALAKGDIAGRWKTRLKERRQVVPKRVLQEPYQRGDSWNPTRPWNWEELCQVPDL